MNVIKATNNDKQAVIEFCKNTFSWGDYISDVWESWLEEGHFLTIHENNSPVAICHASLNEQGKQIWIEGIRVNENFRRKGYASKLVIECEKLGKQNECTTSYMLIESTNKKSLDLARKLNYKNFETWNFFSLAPTKNSKEININFFQHNDTIQNNFLESNISYVNSWRWFPINDVSFQELVKKQQIIFSTSDLKR